MIELVEVPFFILVLLFEVLRQSHNKHLRDRKNPQVGYNDIINAATLQQKLLFNTKKDSLLKHKPRKKLDMSRKFSKSGCSKTFS